jgi:hypothetical protein
MTGARMIDVLHQNWPDGNALARPTVFQIGLHPPDFDSVFEGRMEQALIEVDRHLYADDAGPIHYARLVDLRKVWSGQ